MKRRYFQRWILLFLVLSFSAQFLDGQTPMISSGEELITFMRSDPEYIRNRLNRYSEVEGSPYLEEDFMGGAVYHNRKKYVNLKLRYNYYEEHFEFRDQEVVKYFDPVLTRLDSVWLGDDLFLYIDYREGKQKRRTFMKEIFRGGETSVLLFRKLILLEAEPASGYKAAQPARFKTVADRYFVKKSGNPAIEFRGRRSIPELFPGHRKELEKFAKEESLRLKDDDEIIRLCTYYETLE